MTRTRAAFTLVELLVVLAVALVLAGIAALVLPGALSQDRTTDGAATVRQYLMIAKNRAARDGLPRGVRFIVGADPSNPLRVMEIQEIEVPSVLIFNPNQTTRMSTLTPLVNTPLPDASPYFEVIYTVSPGNTPPNPATNPPAGEIMPQPLGRQFFLRKIPQDQASNIPLGATLTLNVPEFNNYWCRFQAVSQSASVPATNPGTVDFIINVDVPPDDYIGATTQAISYRFGINGLPSPLMGQPAIALPRNICVDLSVSQPQWTAALAATVGDYDILFAPSGQVLSRGAATGAGGQIFLWVRDYTKDANPLNFQTAGEQQIVALKTASGSLGVFPVMWPPYATGQDPYTFARMGANSP